MSAASSTPKDQATNKAGNNLASVDADKGDIMAQRRAGEPLEQTSKHDLIEERRSNLPLPEDPPVKSDWNSADPTTVNVSSGSRQDDTSLGNASETGLREPATVGTDGISGNIGRQGVEGLSGPPKDATSSGNSGN